MKKNNPVFGVLFAVVVAAIFLAVSFPKEKTASIATAPTPALHQYY
jgi:hypothetical protein